MSTIPERKGCNVFKEKYAFGSSVFHGDTCSVHEKCLHQEVQVFQHFFCGYFLDCPVPQPSIAVTGFSELDDETQFPSKYFTKKGSGLLFLLHHGPSLADKHW